MNIVKLLRSIFSKKDALKLGLITFLITISGIMEMASIFILFTYISILTDPQSHRAQTIHNIIAKYSGLEAEKWTILIFGVLVLGYFFFKGIINILETTVTLIFLNQKQEKFSDHLYGLIIRADQLFLAAIGRERIAKNLKNDVERAFKQVIHPSAIMFADFITLGFIIGVLFIYNPKLALIGGGTITFISCILFLSVKSRISKHSLRSIQANKNAIRVIDTSMVGMKEIILGGKENYYKRKFNEALMTLGRAILYVNLLGFLPRLINEYILVIAIVMTTTLLIVDGQSVVSMLPTLTGFAFAGIRLIGILSRISGGATQIRFHSEALEEITSLRDELADHKRSEPDPDSPWSRDNPIPFEQSIEIENVGFNYPKNIGDDGRVIRDISFSIKKNTSVAIVGQSGAGKTTLLNIILGLYPPVSGAIMVDGYDILKNLPAWHTHIGYVPQRPILLPGTIKENIAPGVENPDENRIWECLKIAHLDDIIKKMPNGLNTYTDDFSGGLSGGQTQRLAIARALYGDPDILVFDEATSALDNITESTIINAINMIGRKKTIISVAHRLSTVKNADKIIYLENGHIAGEGTYDQLNEECDGFRKMSGHK